MSSRHRPQPPPARPKTEDEVAVVYGILSQRLAMNNDVLWRIISFALGAQVSAYIGLFTVKGSSAWLYIILGIAVAGMGIIGPLTTRSVETSLLLDRLLLDQYEAQLLDEHPELRTFHGARLVDRIAKIGGRFDDAAQRRLAERRFDGLKRAEQLNRLFDKVGQPSLVWVAIMGIAGAVGFDIGLSKGLKSGALLVGLCIGTNVFMVVLWTMASGFFRAGLGKALWAPMARMALLFVLVCVIVPKDVAEPIKMSSGDPRATTTTVPTITTTSSGSNSTSTVANTTTTSGP